ncbi:MAG: hypothetical protein SVR08_07585 [Spirochaetota bacterium]|nr:hypothetical protein [Spirochaetota bacterium]
MKIFLYISVVMLIFTNASLGEQTEKIQFPLIDEGRSFWGEVIQDKTINNGNLLYASYIAYRDRLNDLSVETFNECIKENESNNMIIGIINYYLGKNLYLLGKYKEAIEKFISIQKFDLKKFNYIKMAALYNSALSYYKLDNIEKFRENLLKIISEDSSGKYKNKALDTISKVKG